MSDRKWTPPSWQSWEYHSGYHQALYDSAAPEIYEALEAMTERMALYSGGTDDEMTSKARTALAKARGEQ